MAKPSKGVSNVLQMWWAMRSQKRRRAGAAAPRDIPAPVIQGGWLDISEVNPDWVDALVDFTFDGAGLPAGVLEVEACLSSDAGNWQSRLTVPVGTTHFRDDMIFTNQDEAHYRMRFVSGGLVGPYSEELVIGL